MEAKIQREKVTHAQRNTKNAVRHPKTRMPDRLSKGQCNMVRKVMTAMESHVRWRACVG